MVIESPWPTLEPYPKEPLASWLEGSSLRFGDKAAFLDREGRGYTFRETFTLARRIGRLLQEQGIPKGEAVAIVSPNTPFYIVASLGVLWAGGALLPLNPLQKERELQHLLADSRARAALVTGDLLPRLEAIKGDLPDLEAVHVLDELEARAAQVPAEPLPLAIDPLEDPAILMSTGGTTGLPKEAVRTHYHITTAIRQIVLIRGFNSFSTILLFTPFFHSLGLVGLGLYGLAVGATQVVMPRFDPEEALALTEKFRITYIALAPPALAALNRAAQNSRYDLASLSCIITGSAALPEELAAEARQVLDCFISQGYGHGETSVTNNNPSHRVKAASVGPPMPDTLEKVVDPEGDEEVPPGEVGELLVKGPQVFRAYWRNPEATAEAVTPDGWFRTGDLAWADEEGYVYIVDRKKEVIKYKGYQVTPAELEAVLLEHPAVLEAAVIPKEAREVGEIPKALVVLRPGAQASPEELKKELMAFVEERVAPYKKVREVEFIDAIPRSPLGKVFRRELIERERARG
ncbi:MAG TPA: AMP-binding protein [Dehalococcoidia bacterium]|nr:AMP-binding protein [Dehalococcoidia bacterium]